MRKPVHFGAMDIQLGYWRWKLFRWNDHPNPYRNRPDLALNWLRQFQNNPAVISELRHLLGTSVTGQSPTTDTQLLLQQIANKLSSGELQAFVELCGPVAVSASVTVTEEAAEPDLSQLVQTQPPPEKAPPPEAAPESTLSPATDPVAMAQALKDAAQTGSPFCEECQKAAA
jgi:hypothetical protein